MQNALIIILLIIVVVIGSILYIYRDEINHRYKKTSGKVKAHISRAVRRVKKDIEN